MIKYQTFRFEKLDVPDHWLSFPNFSVTYQTEQRYADLRQEVEIHLDPEKVYQLSMDQSSSNTGIFIKDFENTEAYLIEFRNNKRMDASEYIYQLELLLHYICEGITFSHLIYEKPIKGESFQSSRVLFQLEGMIKALGRRYPEFSAAKLDCIENASWFSVTVGQQFSQYGRKEACRLAINKIFPWTIEYGASLYRDNDIFDAIGIMMGWFMNSFDPFGRPYVRGDKSNRPVGGFCLPGIPGKKVQEMLAEEGIECEFYVENPRYSICANLTANVKPNTLHCVEISTKYTMLCLCIECNIRWMNPEVMTIIVCDAATINTKLNKIAGGEFHFVL